MSVPSIHRKTIRTDEWMYHGLAQVKHTEGEPGATFSLYHDRRWYELHDYSRVQLAFLRDFLNQVLQEWPE